MPIDLTRVYRQVNNIKKGLFYRGRPSLYFMNLQDLLLEITDGFYIGKSQSQNSSGETWKCSIAENEDLYGSMDDVIPLTTVLVFQNEQFKILSYERPRASTQVWDLILQSTGELSSLDG